jgi:hypothetical protein
LYFFFRVIIVTSMKSLGHSPVMLLISCVISLRPSLPTFWVHRQVHHHLL